MSVNGPSGYTPISSGLANELITPRQSEAQLRVKKAQRQLTLACVVCFIFMAGEVVGGYMAGSLAILSDAAHMLSDVASLLISLVALWLAGKQATARHTYGFYRAEILGAMASVLLIWVLTGLLIYEGVNRVQNPQPVDGKIMFIVAACGLAVNIGMGVILHQPGAFGGLIKHGHSHGGGGAKELKHHGSEDEPHSHPHGHGHDHGHDHGHGHGHDHGHGHGGHGQSPAHTPRKSTHGHSHSNINVRAAFIHVLGDLLQSVGVMAAAVVIWVKPELTIVDPICTFVFSLLVMLTTIKLTRDNVAIFMESTPDGISWREMHDDLLALEDVTAVHDLHVWSLTLDKLALSVHLETDKKDHDHVLLSASQLLADEYGIEHVTVQVERDDLRNLFQCSSSCHSV